jgi:hypothetical protein
LIYGVFSGIVNNISNTINDNSDIKDLAAKLRHAQEIITSRSGISEEDFLRTLFMNGPVSYWENRDESRMSGEDLMTAKMWWQWMRSGGGDSTHGSLNNDFRDLYYRRFPVDFQDTSSTIFTCNSGLIGLARSPVRKNDRVYVVKGSPMPFLLRPCEPPLELFSDGVTRANYFNFVGGCYLDKCMDGEAVEGDVEWETLVLC